MKFFAALIMVPAVSTGNCGPLHAALPTPQQIVELTEATTVYVQSILPKADFAPLHDFKNNRLKFPEIDTDVTVSGNNGIAYGVNHLLFDQYDFDPLTSSTKIRLTAPNTTEVYDYEAEGKMFGHKVSGKGILKIETIGYGYVVSDLRFEEINHSLQITSLEISFVLDSVKLELGGMKVDKVTVQQLEKLMDEFTMARFNENKGRLNKEMASLMKTEFNKMLSGHSTEEVIQWLKEHTHEEVQSDFVHNFIFPYLNF